jgi:hypothetical protein
MTENLQLEFDRLAGQAHPSERLLLRVRQGVARRRTRRRRLATAGTAAAVVAVVSAVVLIAPNSSGGDVRPVAVADSTPVPTTRDLPGPQGSAPTSCVAPDYVPDPAPLTRLRTGGAANLELAVIPEGWAMVVTEPTFTMYAAPHDPRRTNYFMGRIVIMTGSADDRPADFTPTTTINGHPAAISRVDPCATATSPGQWTITVQWQQDQTITVQGPLSLHLDDQQLRDVAASAVVRQYTASHG